MADPRISRWLMILSYVVGGVGVFLGMYWLAGGRSVKALHWALPFMAGGVGILAMLRHSLFHESDAARTAAETGDPFYMIELGYANGALGAIALVAVFARWGVGAEVALGLTYALYLLLAYTLFAVKAVRSGLDGGKIMGLIAWPLMVGFLAAFSIAAMAEAHL
jgi:hypothetical protein